MSLQLRIKILHDAEASVRSIKKLNEHLPDKLKFHGWVTIWEGYELDDHSKVTVSANPAKELYFLTSVNEISFAYIGDLYGIY